MMSKIGILLINTGTPDAPTPHAVRRYLQEFLSDKRIVKIPRLIWLPILHGLVLTTRPRRSAKLYQQIWTKEGAPLRKAMLNLQASLQSHLNNPKKLDKTYHIEIGMNYGSPSIKQGLHNLHQLKVDHLIVLPLFPQYSNTSTGSSYDRTLVALKQWSALPSISIINNYTDNHRYIDALAESVLLTPDRDHRHLLISFHGIPKRFVQMGDPYPIQCEKTAHLLAKKLNLANHQWTLCYQSQFGYDKWLTPSTQHLLAELPKKHKVKHIDVICPGFSVDCLETLEEIAISGKESFLAAGGESFRYIPALNHTSQQVELIAHLICKEVKRN